MEIKRLIDTSRKVADSVDKDTRKKLFRSGGALKKQVRALIRRGKRTSTPGNPPTSKTGTLKRTIFFVVDESKEVVVGPIGFSRNSGIATGALEHGGESVTKDGHRFNVERRPYVSAGFEKAKDTLRSIWES
jgi:hypothetical protein